ncbi:bifunctional 3'-5' exonuclease/DNA polymerase [uncultured Caudovirales phage]|uniref:Bifunctional 3'-5' exonuclease/DNA polymerase n=1 Tax=uncultured Caudovirales phage TaxID=2100421 RepID=A0A6J5MGJ7_9CAUD|nr:bifunctional 3'-5' exonuclease/DNA polymerase [uncultured Caudovirales phage]
MTTLYLDLETFSSVPITHGTHAYAEKSEVLLVAYAFDEEAVQVMDLTAGGSLDNVQMLIDSADTVVIHNSAFDRTVLRHHNVYISVDKVHDTMVQAMAHSLPGSLGQLCDILKVPTDKAKDKAGKRLIHLFTKPLGKNRILDRATSATHPDEWAEFVEYARLDVEAMRSVYTALPVWNLTASERSLWLLDQRINDRGVAVDRELATAALRAAQRAGRALAAEISDLTGGAVANTTQRGKTLDHLRSIGLETEDLKKGTVKALLAGTDISPPVRAMLEVRLQAAATSPAKYRTLLQATSADGRLRGTLQFCGATRTGRWGGRLFQPQNLPRPTLNQKDIDFGVAAMKADIEDVLFSNVMELCTSAVRGCLIAPEDKKLVIADLSNIEGRMLAFLAGEQWKLDAFRDFDKGIGHDIYKLAYAKSFNIKPEDVTKDQRQLGKVQELALGYQGGLGAFSTMAALYGVNLSEETINSLVTAWRKAHPKTKNLWYNCESAAKDAVRNPGKNHKAGKLVFRADDGWLRMMLPSERYLCYPNAEVDDSGKLTYEGVNQYTRKWERLETYGGKLVENATQAASRDILAFGMKAAEREGYEVVLHVHDELICETPDIEEYSVDKLAQMMSSGPLWAVGLPLAAAGFETTRYRKE